MTVQLTLPFCKSSKVPVTGGHTKPVVYAALDEDLSAELFPESEVCLFHLIEELWRYEHLPYS